MQRVQDLDEGVVDGLAVEVRGLRGDLVVVRREGLRRRPLVEVATGTN